MAQKKKSTQKAKKTDKAGVGGRIIWSVVLLAVTILLFLPLFGLDDKGAAFIPGAVKTAVSALIGRGWIFLPFALLLLVILLLFVRSRRIIRQSLGLLLLPVLSGMIFHLASGAKYESLIKLLQTGRDYVSGGLISGGIASLFVLLISQVGTWILTIALIIIAVIFCFDLSVAQGIWYIGEAFAKLDIPGRIKRSRERARAKRLNRPAKPVQKKQESAVGAFTPPPRVDFPVDDPVNARPQNQYFKTPTMVPGLKPTVKSPAEVVLEQRADELEESAGEDEDVFIPGVDETADEPTEGGTYQYPPLNLLITNPPPSGEDAAEEIRQNGQRLLETLSSFNIDARIINVTRGPTVTRYEVQMSKGIKFSKLTSLSDDIALALGAQAVRIAPIPDKIAVGIEVPNKVISTVYLRDVLASPEFESSKSKVSFAMGKDIAGQPVIGDIARLPHLLIAGTTGSGKSVCVNSLLVSLLYKAAPSEVRLIMIDPKMIELGVYNGIPHLLIPVVTDPKKAAGALGWAVGEMLRRYKLLSGVGVRDLESYNSAVAPDGEPLPQIVIVIDELADLMLAAPGEVEEAICRLAQMARAAGMYLIIATQRPSADVITGIMKANIPSRIAFSVASQLESRIIMDTGGAEKLIGRGDMLFSPIGMSKPTRVQGGFITSSEVEAVVEFVKKRFSADYNDEVIEHIERAAIENGENKKSSAEKASEESDPMFNAAVDAVMESGQASTSLLQRRLKLGYSRAARLIDEMEERGIVGPFEGAKPRQLMITKQDWMEIKLRMQD